MNENAASPRPRAARTSGFTLIELLTVIAIIGILASILIPVVGRVRQAAKNTQCVSNVRSWGQAIIIYAEENNGNYAVRKNWSNEGVSSWPSTTSDYATEIINLGETTRDFRTCPLYDGEDEITYTINWPSVAGEQPPREAVPLGSAVDPTNLLLLMDAAHGAPEPFAIDGTAASPRIGARHVIRLTISPLNRERHEGFMNAVFADGHIRRVFWDPEDDSHRDNLDAQWDLWTEIFPQE